MSKNDDSLRGMRREDMTAQQRIAVANREMEESSARCVRVLYQTMDMADNTSMELYQQAEVLGKTETHLDRIDVDLDNSKRNVKEIKSVWGGLVNNVTSAKQKMFKSRSSPRPSPPPPDKHQQGGNKKTPTTQAQAGAQAGTTGNEVVDRNLVEVGKCLQMLEGQARVIGHQVDESVVQIDRIKSKMDKSNIQLKSINRDLSEELRR